MPTKKIKLEDLLPDDINANRGTVRGVGMLEKSLRDFGAGRSILVDKNNRIIAGNKTAEAAGLIGLDDVRVVETDGTKVVVVKRTDIDIDSATGRGLALADNRVAEVGLDWDPEALEKLSGTADLLSFFFEEELDAMNVPIPGQENEEVRNYRDELDRLTENYDNAEIRQVVLLFSGEDYDKAIELLGMVCDKFQVPDFASAVLELLRRETSD
jgi:sporulation protein YlmC with PRC-barrel domain